MKAELVQRACQRGSIEAGSYRSIRVRSPLAGVVLVLSVMSGSLMNEDPPRRQGVVIVGLGGRKLVELRGLEPLTF
jgi:hypothetical protein